MRFYLGFLWVWGVEPPRLRRGGSSCEALQLVPESVTLLRLPTAIICIILPQLG